MRNDSSDLVPLILPSPSKGIQFAIGKILSWDPENFNNEVEFRGVILTNLNVHSGTEALTYQPGDIVELNGWVPEDRGGVGTWWIRGKIVIPGAGRGEEAVSFLQTELATALVDELVEALIDSPAGRILIDSIVEDLLVSPAGQTLIDGIVEDLLTSQAGQDLAAFVIGQRVHSASVATAQSTTSTSYTNLSTTGPTISTVPVSSSGRALVMVTAVLTASTTSIDETVGALMSYQVSGATSRSPADGKSVFNYLDDIAGDATGSQIRATAISLETGLNEGNHTFQAKYRSLDGSTVLFAQRNITVIAF